MIPPALFRRPATIVVAACLVVLSVGAIAHAGSPVRLNGSLSTDLYFLDDGADNRVQSYHAFRATLTAPTSTGKYWQVRTNLRWRKDLDNSPRDVDQLYVYETYLQFAGIIKRSNLTVGRQFIYSNLGAALVDGGRLKLGFGKRLSVEIYGGSQVQSGQPDKVKSISDFGTAGARFSGKIDNLSNWGLEGLLRKYDGSVSYSAVGIDLARSKSISQMYAQAAYDIANNRFALLRGRVSLSPQKWFVSGEFIWREPVVRANSLFSVVSFERYRLARLGLRRNLRGQLALDGSAGLSFGSPTTTLYSTLGLTGGNWGVGWRHQNGRGTSSNGIYGFANIDLSRQWSIYGNTDLSRYRIQELQESLSDAYSASAGLSFRPGSDFTIRAEAQFLRNAVSSSDTRLFIRILKGFSVQRYSTEGRP